MNHTGLAFLAATLAAAAISSAAPPARGTATIVQTIPYDVPG